MSNKTTQQSQVTTLDDPTPESKAVDAAPATAADVFIAHNANLSGKRKTLTIHTEQGEGGNFAVFIGLNGVGYQVPRGKPWNVPVELVNNLRHATQTIWDGNTPRESPRFAYTVEDAPDAAPASETAAA